MNIYEYKMEIDVSLSSQDQKMNDIYQLIKEKILKAPERYDRTIKKKGTITNKIGFAVGVIPSLIVCSLLALIPTVREVYGASYVLFPIVASILALLIGNTAFGGKLDRLYKTIVPEQKYAGYDANKHKSIYKDDIDKFLTTSEIIIGKNVDNIRNREEIIRLEEKYSKYIPMGILAIIMLSIIMIFIGKLL